MESRVLCAEWLVENIGRPSARFMSRLALDLFFDVYERDLKLPSMFVRVHALRTPSPSLCCRVVFSIC